MLARRDHHASRLAYKHNPFETAKIVQDNPYPAETTGILPVLRVNQGSHVVPRQAKGALQCQAFQTSKIVPSLYLQ